MKRIFATLLGWAFAFGLINSVAFADEPMEAIAQKARSLEDFLSQPNLVKEYESAVRKFLGKDQFPCESFQGIVQRIQKFPVQFPEEAKRLWEKKSNFPSQEISYQGKKITFRHVSRRFHALWAEASGDGCQPQACESSFALTPTRWSTLVSDALFFWVEKEGAFTGSAVWVLPLQRSGKQYGFVSQMGPTIVGVREDKEILSQWGETLHRVFPPSWAGLVSLIPQNETYPLPMFQELNVLGEKKLVIAREFSAVEPLEKIAKEFPRSCFSRKADAGMDLYYGDLFGNGTALVKSLSLPLASDPKAVEQWLYDMKGIPSRNWAEKVDKENLENYRVAFDILLKKSRHPSVRRRAAIALGDILNRKPVELTESLFSKNSLKDWLPKWGGSGRSLAEKSPSSRAGNDKNVAPFAPSPFEGTAVSSLNTFEGKSVSSLNTLRSALSDPDQGVQGAAALSLFRNGDNSSQVESPLSRLFSKVGGDLFSSPEEKSREAGPKSNEWDDVFGRLPRNPPLPSPALAALLDRMKTLPEDKKKTVGRKMTRAYMKGDEKALAEVKTLPQHQREEFINIVNSEPSNTICTPPGTDMLGIPTTRAEIKKVQPLLATISGHDRELSLSSKREVDSSQPPTAFKCDPTNPKRFPLDKIKPTPMSVIYVWVNENAELASLPISDSATCKPAFFDWDTKNRTALYQGVVTSDTSNPTFANVMLAEQWGKPGPAFYTVIDNQPVPVPCGPALKWLEHLAVTVLPPNSQAPVKIRLNPQFVFEFFKATYEHGLEKYRSLLTVQQQNELDQFLSKNFPNTYALKKLIPVITDWLLRPRSSPEPTPGQPKNP